MDYECGHRVLMLKILTDLLKLDIKEALENSKLFLCCINKKYTEKKSCIENEMRVCNELKLPGILSFG